jgi:hypothetical protein
LPGPSAIDLKLSKQEERPILSTIPSKEKIMISRNKKQKRRVRSVKNVGSEIAFLLSGHENSGTRNNAPISDSWVAICSKTLFNADRPNQIKTSPSLENISYNGVRL